MEALKLAFALFFAVLVITCVLMIFVVLISIIGSYFGEGVAATLATLLFLFGLCYISAFIIVK